MLFAWLNTNTLREYICDIKTWYDVYLQQKDVSY